MGVSGGIIGPSSSIVRRSGVDPLPFRLVSASDHVTPMAGLSPAVALSKDGRAFGPPLGAVMEIGHGAYRVAPDPDDVDAVGPLVLVATAPGADPYRALIDVVPQAGLAPIPSGITTYPLVFYLGAPGLSPSLLVSKAGAPFVAPAGTPLVEVGGPGNGLGFYATTPNATDTATPGALLLHATATDGGTSYFGGAAYRVAGTPPVASALADMALAMQAAIVNSGLFPLPACVISQEEEPFPSPAPPCCWIGVGDFAPDVPFSQGMGRYGAVVEGEYTVRVILRRTRDVDQQDTQLLTNAAGGLPLVENLINVLLEVLPLDTQGEQLTSGTLKCAGVGRARPYGKDRMLAVVPVRFRARIQLRLSVPGPP